MPDQYPMPDTAAMERRLSRRYPDLAVRVVFQNVADEYLTQWVGYTGALDQLERYQLLTDLMRRHVAQGACLDGRCAREWNEYGDEIYVCRDGERADGEPLYVVTTKTIVRKPDRDPQPAERRIASAKMQRQVARLLRPFLSRA